MIALMTGYMTTWTSVVYMPPSAPNPVYPSTAPPVSISHPLHADPASSPPAPSIRPHIPRTRSAASSARSWSPAGLREGGPGLLRHRHDVRDVSSVFIDFDVVLHLPRVVLVLCSANCIVAFISPTQLKRSKIQTNNEAAICSYHIQHLSPPSSYRANERNSKNTRPENKASRKEQVP